MNELTIPLTLTLRLESTGQPDAQLQTSAPTLEVRRLPRESYQGLRGYNPAFLGAEVPVPLIPLTDAQRVNAAKNSDAEPEDDPTELKYMHFSVVMSRARQLAYYTVVNIDGAESKNIRRQQDTWSYDPRIAESEQIGNDLYARNDLDRGHLVRRLDPVWGDNAQIANDNTFHFTNCSPQHALFNQGDQLWQGLENYLLDGAQSKQRRVTVFTGPVMRDDDPLYRGVRLPLEFWKVIYYMNGAGTLLKAGYLLDQRALVNELLATEADFKPGLYRIRIAELEESTGLQFSKLPGEEVAMSESGLEKYETRVLLRQLYKQW